MLWVTHSIEARGGRVDMGGRYRRGFTLEQRGGAVPSPNLSLATNLCLQHQYAVVKPVNSYTGTFLDRLSG